MGAGGKAINIFKFNKGDDPDQVINWRLWFVRDPQHNDSLLHKPVACSCPDTEGLFASLCYF